MYIHMDYYDAKVDSFPLEVGSHDSPSYFHLHDEKVSGFPQLSKCLEIWLIVEFNLIVLYKLILL